MYTSIEQKVEQLFADALKQYSKSIFCENPVTGEYFHAGGRPSPSTQSTGYKGFVGAGTVPA